MSSRSSLTIALQAALVIAIGSAENPSSAEPRGATPSPISVERLAAVTRTLASDEYEGREPGTPGEA